MNEKEISELRRRFKPGRSGISTVRGCFVSQERQVLSEFSQSLGLMTDDESGQILGLLKKALSGNPGGTLSDIEFETQQVVSGREHGLLMALRNSRLRDDGAVRTLCQRITESLDMDGSYIILLAHDAYDVPYRSGDGERQADASDQMFSYIVCAVCPLKMTKPGLTYSTPQECFRGIAADWVIDAPEVGFMFPAFDDRQTNIYGALYYNRDLGENHAALAEALFRREAPMAAKLQKEAFRSLLGDAVGDDCTLDVVEAVHGHLSGLIAAHRESGDSEPLRFKKGAVRRILDDCGVSAARADDFERGFDERFGPDAALNPVSVVDARRMEVSTPSVTIQVDPERTDLIETRVINGARCIVIRVDEGVEVNGVPIRITK